MIVCYFGMNCSDGLIVIDFEYISQSIGDILCILVGLWVMCCDYGLLLVLMIDQLQILVFELQIKVVCYMVVLKWEFCVILLFVIIECSFDG